MEENKRLDHLYKLEIRFHLAKMIMLIAVAMIASVFIIQTVVRDNDRTRGYIKCIVTSPYNGNQDHNRELLKKCDY